MICARSSTLTAIRWTNPKRRNTARCWCNAALNVFRAKNTAHRVTPVEGKTARMIAVFSFYDSPGVRFTAEEQRGFYGRTL